MSGKGGVGKTTTTVNLGVALHNFNEKVVIVDTNLVTPNLALQLGFPPSPTTLHNVLRGEAKLNDAIHVHNSGLNVIPAGLSMSSPTDMFVVNYKNALSPLSKKYDLVLLDCGAGLWGEVLNSMKVADEILIVTNPELPALVDSLKAIKIAEKFGIKIRGVVLTKVTGNGYELEDNTVKGILKNYPILAKIPFDKNVPRSISLRRPVLDYKPNSPASRAYKKLAASMSGKSYSDGTIYKMLDALGLSK